MKTFKILLRLVLTSILATLTLALIMLKVTMDFQWLLFIGSALFFLAGLFNSNLKVNLILSTAIITSLYLTLFVVMVLNQLPGLYSFVPIYFVSCALGLLFNTKKKTVGFASAFLVLVMFILGFKVIPGNIQNNLTHHKSDPLPSFELTTLNGKIKSSEEFKGKVLVLDFFGTWCAPCRKELPELQKVKDYFQNNNEVIFFVINADIGGDTPQKFQAFINANTYNFDFVYDYGSKLYKQLNLQSSGLPSLLIVDKNQTIKMLHLGYNAAEISFIEHIIETIENLL